MLDILLVEDDWQVARTVVDAWPVAGDKLRIVSSFKQCLSIVQTAEIDFFDGVIVDVNLPDGDGLEILRAVRKHSDIPLVLISGGGSADSRASALDLGADDYVMKPFSVRELQARLARAATKSHVRSARPVQEIASIGQVRCNLSSRVLEYEGRTIEITELEARLISELHKNINRDCSKSYLSKKACFREYESRDKTIDVYIGRLRRKTGSLHAGSAECLKTVRGIGYRLID